MAKEGSVAPKERVNIIYKSSTGNAQEEVELPEKILMVGEYTGRADDRPMEERRPINIDKSNFNEVMAKQDLALTFAVADKLSETAGGTLAVKLELESLADFGPEGIVRQVPELQKLLELRAALNALKGPLGNVPAFRKKIQALLADGEGRQKLMKELGMAEGGPKETP